MESPALDAERRQQVFAGNLFVYEPRPSGKALCDHAWQLIREAFSPIDPRDAQFEMKVEDFVKIISPLKTQFTHHPRSKQLLRALLEELGCNPEETYFDVPKLRIVTSGGYLVAGVGYAYKHHRDTWYACPPAQINWWTPITEITPESAFVLHPKLDWHVVVGKPGSALLFSAQHLHATVPNTSGRTRFSIDFRTVHREDIEGQRRQTRGLVRDRNDLARLPAGHGFRALARGGGLHVRHGQSQRRAGFRSLSRCAFDVSYGPLRAQRLRLPQANGPRFAGVSGAHRVSASRATASSEKPRRPSPVPAIREWFASGYTSNPGTPPS